MLDFTSELEPDIVPSSILKIRTGKWVSDIRVKKTFYRISMANFSRSQRRYVRSSNWIEQNREYAVNTFNHKQTYLRMIEWCETYSSGYWHNYYRNKWYFLKKEDAITFHMLYADIYDVLSEHKGFD